MVFFGQGADEKNTEMAPSTISNASAQMTATSTKETPLLDTNDQGDMVIVDRPHVRMVDKQNTAGIGTRDSVEGGSGLDIASMGKAASFVNEQVGKVRQMATEGPLSFRVLAFLGGVAIIITSVLDLLGEIFHLSVIKAVVSVYTFIFGVFICILEGRTFVPETLKYQRKIVSLAKFLKFVWGRGIFYFFAGSLHFSQMGFLNMVSGGFVCFVGIISIITGWSTASKLKQMRESLSTQSALNEKFNRHDDDHDGFMDSTNFAEFVKDMGLELDHNELVAAFATIDKDDDEKISLEDISLWWNGFQATSVREASLMV